jgi:hypothetical protein
VHRKHLILMILGCAVPILLLAAIFLLQIEVGKALLFAIILVCPLSHLLMLGGQGHEQPPGEHQQTGADHG